MDELRKRIGDILEATDGMDIDTQAELLIGGLGLSATVDERCGTMQIEGCVSNMEKAEKQ